MVAVTAIIDMTVEEAQMHDAAIDEAFNRARWHLLEMKERGGWAVLGFKSWREYAQSKTDKSMAHVYRLLNAAQVERILGDNSPQGENTERLLRPLTKKGYTADAVKALYQVADNWAKTNAVKLTPSIVETVCETLGEAMTTGAFQDGDGEQHPLLEKLDADITARVMETKKRQHAYIQENIERKTAKRRYILDSVEVAYWSIGAGGSLSLLVQLSNSDQAGQIDDLKTMRLAVWVEQAENTSPENI